MNANWMYIFIKKPIKVIGKCSIKLSANSFMQKNTKMRPKSGWKGSWGKREWNESGWEKDKKNEMSCHSVMNWKPICHNTLISNPHSVYIEKQVKLCRSNTGHSITLDSHTMKMKHNLNGTLTKANIKYSFSKIDLIFFVQCSRFLFVACREFNSYFYKFFVTKKFCM